MLKMNSKKAEWLMMSVSLAWGSSYLFMKIGLGGLAPFNLIFLRFGIAFIFLALIFGRHFRDMSLSILLKGLFLGSLLFLIFSCMVIGLSQTTASTAGFMTSMTVVMVPILESVFRRALPSKSIIFSVVLAMFGLFLLTAKDGMVFNQGAVLCLMGAFLYAVYILVLDKFAHQEGLLLISVLQLGVTSLLGAVFMLGTEAPTLPATPLQWAAILALGILCNALGFIVQSFAQKHVSPNRIGLLFSLESVFSAVLAFVFLHEILALRDYMGAICILLSVVLPSLLKDEKKFSLFWMKRNCLKYKKTTPLRSDFNRFSAHKSPAGHCRRRLFRHFLGPRV